MPWLDGAIKREVKVGAWSKLSKRELRGAVILHTNGFAAPGGSLFDTWTRVALDGSTKGAQIQVKSNGDFEQYTDTDNVVYHAFDASEFAVGVETEDGGVCNKPWTVAQLDTIINICTQLDAPPVLLQETSSDGVGWHRLFPSWNKNNHACPCDARQRQITDIIIPALGVDVDPVQDLMLRRSWFFIKGVAQANGIACPDTPEKDLEDSEGPNQFKGWANDAGKTQKEPA